LLTGPDGRMNAAVVGYFAQGVSIQAGGHLAPPDALT
jgi:hypothetical protein